MGPLFLEEDLRGGPRLIWGFKRAGVSVVPNEVEGERRDTEPPSFLLIFSLSPLK